MLRKVYIRLSILFYFLEFKIFLNKMSFKKLESHKLRLNIMFFFAKIYENLKIYIKLTME